MHPESVSVSLIIPVYNNSKDLVECVSALRTATRLLQSEIIVVNDGSTDETKSIADGLGVTVIDLSQNLGGAAARNYGAKHARGEVLFFVDSDVVVKPETIHIVTNFFDRQSEYAAIFGSYDTDPRAEGLVSQYRNLLHHYFHQRGKSEASTFWTGCGAIRRSAFEGVGGFNEDFATNLEDVELGYRLKRAGYRIFLDKKLQVTHLKQWTFKTMIKADVMSRAIPWSRLIVEARDFPNDLNVDVTQRVSVTLVMMSVVCLISAIVWVPLLFVSSSMILATVILNRPLFVFFSRERGVLFACSCIPLVMLYYLYSGTAFLTVWLLWNSGLDKLQGLVPGQK